MTHSLFTKIFVWFWIALAAITLSISIIAVIGGMQPLKRRLTLFLGLYAENSVHIYTEGGSGALRRFLDDAETISGIQATLIDPQGRDILDRNFPQSAEKVEATARHNGTAKLLAGMTWMGASVVHTQSGDFVLVARAYPFRGVGSRGGLATSLSRVAIALLSAGLLCWLIARHITSPIRILQSAAARISEGDLSVRASPGIPPRNDELAELARDFDSMADRVQTLILKQQELLADISHELRSPLTRLSVSLELASRGEEESFKRMRTDLDRLDQQIGQVLTLSRLQLQEGQKNQSPVEMRAIVESVADDANYEGQNEGKSVAITHADECWINGDSNLLRSCLENVVRNALRYTNSETSVEIALARSDGLSAMAIITIADHGPGIPIESIRRIFEPFYRVSGSRDRVSGGTGLGLSIAQKVVLVHGGTIEARNRDGGGLIMEIRLPVVSAPQMSSIPLPPL